MKILALDPGFDITGWALFWFRETPDTLNLAIRAMCGFGEIETSTSDTDAERLRSMGLQLRNLIDGHTPKVVFIEMPAIQGDYGGKKFRRAGVNKLYMAIGALLSRIDGPAVVKIPAIRTRKEERHQLLAYAAQVSGIDLPAGPRGGAREDAWDAIWLGCQAILDPRFFAWANRKTDRRVG